jgi:hypothetical protein
MLTELMQMAEDVERGSADAGERAAVIAAARQSLSSMEHGGEFVESGAIAVSESDDD